MSQTKDTNPKAALGAAKPGLSVVPSTALYAMAAAHMDGAYKYGAHNWRVSGVSARTYYDAAMRHLTAWWEGEDDRPGQRRGPPRARHGLHGYLDRREGQRHADR